MAATSLRATLLSQTITTANSIAGGTVTKATGNVVSAVCEAIFTYGSGGTSSTAYLQTSLDGGTTWIDIACFAFTTSSASKVVNLSARTPVGTLYTPTDGSLTDNTSKDGILGDQFRVKWVTVGTYAGSTTLKIYLTLKA